MKPETAAALRKLDSRQACELVAFMAELMPPEEFCNALNVPAKDESSDTLSEHGSPIYDELIERFSEDIPREMLRLDELHEAICEGRAQDALDILIDATGENLRPARQQNYLFPHRAPILKLEF